MAAHRIPSLVAAVLCSGVLADCRHAADVDGMRGNCCGASQASTGPDSATPAPRTRHRPLTIPTVLSGPPVDENLQAALDRAIYRRGVHLTNRRDSSHWRSPRMVLLGARRSKRTSETPHHFQPNRERLKVSLSPSKNDHPECMMEARLENSFQYWSCDFWYRMTKAHINNASTSGYSGRSQSDLTVPSHSLRSQSSSVCLATGTVSRLPIKISSRHGIRVLL